MQDYDKVVSRFIAAGQNLDNIKGKSILKVKKDGSVSFEEKGSKYNIFTKLMRWVNKSDYELPGRNLTELVDDLNIIYLKDSASFDDAISKKAKELSKDSASSDELKAKEEELKKYFKSANTEISKVFERKFKIGFEQKKDFGSLEPSTSSDNVTVEVNKAIQQWKIACVSSIGVEGYDSREIAQQLKNIAELQMKNGDKEGAQKTLNEAKEVLKKINDPLDRFSILIQITKLEDENDARGTLNEAKKVVAEISNPSKKADALITIAQLQIKNGDKEGARKTLHAEEVIAKKTSGNLDSLIQIVKLQIESDDIVGIGEDVNKALDEREWRIGHLTDDLIKIAALLLEKGDKEELKEALNVIKDVVNNDLEDRTHKAYGLIQIVELQFKNGDITEEEKIKELEKIHASSLYALRGVAELHFKNNSIDKANEIIQDMKEIADRMGSDKPRDKATLLLQIADLAQVCPSKT